MNNNVTVSHFWQCINGKQMFRAIKRGRRNEFPSTILKIHIDARHATAKTGHHQFAVNICCICLAMPAIH